MKKPIMYCIVLLIMITHIGCAISADNNVPLDTTAAVWEYSQIQNGEIPNDLRLVIYYMSPLICARYPIDTERIKNTVDTKQIIVDARGIAEHKEQLICLATTELIPKQSKTYLDARVYYVLETDRSGKIFEVAMNSIYGDTFVNGVAVENNSIYSEFIELFLTQDAYEEMLVEEYKAFNITG